MKFSIIIPVYNVAPYLRMCLDSVLAQSFSDWEAICIDDGSSDGSGGILDVYAAGDGRVKVVHQANAGVSAARNVALRLASGEWIGFLDGDDYLSRDFLSNVQRRIDKTGVVSIVSLYPCYEDVDENGATLNHQLALDIPEGTFPGSYLLEEAHGIFNGVWWHACDKFFSRGLLSRTGLAFASDVKLGEDALFIETALLESEGVLSCPMPGGIKRRVRSGSATQTTSATAYISNIYRYSNLYSIYKNKRARCLIPILANDALSLIGLGRGTAVRRQCVSALVANRDFRTIILPSVIKWCGLKSKLSAAILLILPAKIQSLLLNAR